MMISRKAQQVSASSCNILGLVIVALGCIMISLTIVTFMHIVVPIIFPKGTPLHRLVVFVSSFLGFQVLFQYLGAMSVSPVIKHPSETQTTVSTRLSSEGGALRPEDAAQDVGYCRACCHVKYPRERHCFFCGCCVAKMDHHCPWLNNCIGNENLRYFLLFLLFLGLGALWVALPTGYGLYRMAQYRSSVESLANAASSIAHPIKLPPLPFGPHSPSLDHVSVMLCFITSSVLAACMLIFSIWFFYLALTNQTSMEHGLYVRQQALSRLRGAGPMRWKYHIGYWGNFLEVFSTKGDPFVALSRQRNSRIQLAPLLLRRLWDSVALLCWYSGYFYRLYGP